MAKPLAGVRPRAIWSGDTPRRWRSMRFCMLVAKSRISTAVTSRDHAAAVLRGRPGQLQVLGRRRPWCRAPTGASVAVTSMAAWPRPFSSAPAASTTIRLAASSRSLMSAVPANCSLHRAHPDRDLALVLVVAEVLGQLGAGQARGDLGDVVEELPDLVDRLSDLEVVLDQHQASSVVR